MRDELEAMLDRSRPPVPESEMANSLARQLATDLTTTPTRGPRRRFGGVLAAALVGSLSLGAGAAFAGPLLQEWWLWEPAEDLTLTTEPFIHEGKALTCDIMMSVVTDGQTAGDDAVSRLRAARSFLGTITLDDYEAEAQRLLDGELAAFPSEWAHTGFALQRAISNDFRDRGLLGAGVSLESSLECDPS